MRIDRCARAWWTIVAIGMGPLEQRLEVSRNPQVTCMNILKCLFVVGLLLLCSTARSAEQIKDVPYYAQDFPGSGDLQYRAERCKLDICIPEHQDKEKLSTVVWFHGGGLTGGEKHVIEAFTKQKIIVVAAT